MLPLKCRSVIMKASVVPEGGLSFVNLHQPSKTNGPPTLVCQGVDRAPRDSDWKSRQASANAVGEAAKLPAVARSAAAVSRTRFFVSFPPSWTRPTVGRDDKPSSILDPSE